MTWIFFLIFLIFVSEAQIVRREPSKSLTYLGVLLQDLTFVQFAASPLHADALLHQVRSSVASSIDVSVEAVQFTSIVPHTRGLQLLFELHDGTLDVENSDSSDFATYKDKLAASSQSSLEFRGSKVVLVPNPMGQPEDWKEPLGHWPPKDAETDNELMRGELKSRRELLQVRLMDTPVSTFQAKNYIDVARIANSLIQAAAAICSLTVAHGFVTGVLQDSTVLRFSFYPGTQTDVTNWSACWTKGLADSDTRLLSALSDVDMTYPAVYYKDATTTSTSSDTSSDDEASGKGGKIAGAIIGSIGGVALVAAAAAGYVYWRKNKKEEGRHHSSSTARHTAGGDRSPGGSTPNVAVRVEGAGR